MLKKRNSKIQKYEGEKNSEIFLKAVKFDYNSIF